MGYKRASCGKVQSGKTSNYIGLVNKAFDAGYKRIIVLSGIEKDLEYKHK